MELNNKLSVLIAGCGYVGKRLATTFNNAGSRVEAIVKSDESATQLSGNGIQTNILDLDNPDIAMPGKYDVIYYLVPPQKTGTRDQRIRNFLDSIIEFPERIIIFSTTGVYGDCNGEWVDETRLPAPVADRAKRRLDAEIYTKQWCAEHGVDFTILRIPGIYGPGKIPLERVKAKKPVLNREESPWSNRIYIDDLIKVCVASLSERAKNQVFNVSDGNPSTMTDYFIAVSREFGYQEPEQISLQKAQEMFSNEMMSYLSESRRISNKKLLDYLGIEMRYQDLSLGLAQCRNECD